MMKSMYAAAGVMMLGAWFVLAPPIGARQEPSPVPASQDQPAPDAAKVRAAVEQYVQQDTKLKGGFLLSDPEQDQVRNLTFDYVHDAVEPASGNQQVVCVDFLDQNKDRLDVDFFLAPAPSGELEVTDIKIHKVNGVERK